MMSNVPMVTVASEMKDESLVNHQPGEDSLNIRGVNSVIPDVPDVNSEVALYTNSLEIREHMQGTVLHLLHSWRYGLYLSNNFSFHRPYVTDSDHRFSCWHKSYV